MTDDAVLRPRCRAPRQRQLADSRPSSQRFGTSLSGAFAKNVAGGQAPRRRARADRPHAPQRFASRRHEAAAQRLDGPVQERLLELLQRGRRRDRRRFGDGQRRRDLARPGDALREGRRRCRADLLPARPRHGADGRAGRRGGDAARARPRRPPRRACRRAQVPGRCRSRSTSRRPMPKASAAPKPRSPRPSPARWRAGKEDCDDSAP